MTLMSTKKIILIVLGSILVVGLIAGYLWAKAWGKAFGENCETTATIILNEYKIVKSKCIGWAGPPYEGYDLYKNGKELSVSFFNADFCGFYFSQGEDRLLILDTCDQQFSIQYAQKTELRTDEIDSIIVTKKVDSTQKKLNKNEITDFVNRWNRSKPHGPQRIDIESYIQPKYIVKVYGNKQIRKFRTSHFTVQETTNIWDYSFLDENKDRNTQTLDQVFRMN